MGCEQSEVVPFNATLHPDATAQGPGEVPVQHTLPPQQHQP